MVSAGLVIVVPFTVSGSKCLCDSGNMGVIGTAAATEHAQLGQQVGQRPVARGKIGCIAAVELGGFVEFGMAAARGIGADALDATLSTLHPDRARLAKCVGCAQLII